MHSYRGEIRRLITAVNVLDGIYYRMARQSGLPENALALLYALDDGEAHTQKQIVEEWLIPKTTINTIVKEYEALGYITLRAVPGSRHERQICLTEQGKRYAGERLAPLYAAEAEAMADTLRQYPSEFISAMEAFCIHLKKGFEERTENTIA
ncbi:MAG: MarR family transcriptional regulator [Clostridiales bacterium]|nr:MarR family transcriptional regulator [Clostridiales bacterium]